MFQRTAPFLPRATHAERKVPDPCRQEQAAEKRGRAQSLPPREVEAPVRREVRRGGATVNALADRRVRQLITALGAWPRDSVDALRKVLARTDALVHLIRAFTGQA